MKKFIVASASPRRKEIFENAGYTFEVIPSDADEKIESELSPYEAVKLLAFKKAQSVAEKHPEAVVFGCDTVVVSDGVILGKPKDKADAFSTLKKLSGKTHEVITGVCVIENGESESFYEVTRVTFYPLDDKTIESYIETNEVYDKAGSYGIQGFGSVLVEKIEGDYFSVVGLPISKTARLLSKFGIKGKVSL